MCYTVEYSQQALKVIKKLDKQTRALIVGWIEKNLNGCENPRQHGKGLTADKAGLWRYRIGDYRVIADIQDARIVIMITTVGHRRDIYKK